MRRVILISAIFGGIAAAVTGLGLGGLFLLMSAAVRDPAGATLMIAATALGVTVVLGGLGGLLAWHAWQALTARTSAAFRLPGWGRWLLAFTLTVAAGYVAFEIGWTAPVALAHLVANALAVGWALALAAGSAQQGRTPQAGREGVHGPPVRSAGLFQGRTQPAEAWSPEDPPNALSARSMTGSLAWGGLGGTGLAFFVEALVLLGVFLLVSIGLSVARPDLLAQLQESAERLQQSRPDQLFEALPLLRSPWAAAGVLALASVLVPAVEETTKALVVPLVALAGRRVRRADGFLLGVAAGAGFALVEGVLNGALGPAGALVGNNFLLELAPEAERPLYLGLSNTLIGIVVLISGFGGLIVDLLGYGGLFGLSAFLCLLAWWWSRGLPEPRVGK